MGLLERIAKVRAAAHSESENDEQREIFDRHNHPSREMERPEEPSLDAGRSILRDQFPVSTTTNYYILLHMRFILFNEKVSGVAELRPLNCLNMDSSLFPGNMTSLPFTPCLKYALITASFF
jgi:plasmid stability protein